jgi:two-component system cell cycle sensor histidine kinase/response regulator CckA
VHEPLLVLNDEFALVRVSDAFVRQFRIPAADAVGTRLCDLTGGRWNIPELHRLLTAVQHAEAETCRSIVEGDFGFGMRTLVVHARRFVSAASGPQILVAIDDMTDRAATEARCAHLSSVVHSSADSIISWRLDGSVTTWNEGATRLYGYSAAEMIGRSIGRLIPDDRPLELDDLMRRVRAGEHFDRFQTIRRRKDGTRVHISLSLSSMRDNAGNIVGATGVGRDVTARIATEEALHRTLEQLQAVVSSVPMVLWALDRDGIVTLSEGTLLEKLGFKPGQLVGSSALEMFSANKEIIDHMRRALDGEHEHFTIPYGSVTVETWYVPIRDSEGRLQGTLGMGLDITERVRLEEQFRQAQKMDAVGRLAGGIAHDFNNLLTAILGYADLVLDELPAGSALAADIDQIRKAGQSASSLTRQLLAFSRRQLLKPEIICINDVVTRTETLLRRVIGEHIVLFTRLDPALAYASADPGQIEQVIVNLAVNASDAMPNGGHLTIETGNVVIDAAFAAAHVGARTGPHVMMKVSDDGIGMDEAIQKQIFEPFFTTKEKTKGTGLGLSTVYGVVKQSDGTIWVESAPGRGAAFTIYLPVVNAPLTAHVESPSSTLKLDEGQETILLVEDQDDVRRVASAILRHGGYSVVEAAHPRAALAIVRDGQTHFDLLLTDVVMPDMSGRELAKFVGEIRKDLKVLYTSGYAEDAIVEDGVLEAGLAFLPKPFTPKTLLQAVRATLDQDVVD